MSVQRFPDDLLTRLIGAARPHCFICGDLVEGTAVTWSGHAPALSAAGSAATSAETRGAAHLALHPPCAMRLGCELIGDARNASRVERDHPVDAGVNVPHRLMRDLAS